MSIGFFIFRVISKFFPRQIQRIDDKVVGFDVFGQYDIVPFLPKYGIHVPPDLGRIINKGDN